jgi:hypothetical protein
MVVLALLGGGVFATPHLVLTVDKERKRRGDGVTAEERSTFPMPVGRKGSSRISNVAIGDRSAQLVVLTVMEGKPTS